MKKNTFVSILLLTLIAVQAQTYVVGFTASGSSQSVDSVEIYNLNQGTFLEVGGTDTVYFLNGIVGIASNTKHAGALLLFPNPMNQTCHMVFTTETDGPLSINIYNLQGQLVIHKNEYAGAGTHSFVLSGIKTGVYIVSVKTQDKNFVNRLVSLDTRLTEPTLQKTSVEKPFLMQTISKSTKSNVFQMWYWPNDIILFIGKSGNYGRVLTQVLTDDAFIDFNFIPCTDADNNHYKVVTVGQQTWMYENLATTKYIGGYAINNDTGTTQWSTTSEGAYVWYDNDINNKDNYGALYNYFALRGDSICPQGWMLPAYADWTLLIDSAGGASLAGGRLKDRGTNFWAVPNTGATNEYGFTAMPGGFRDAFGLFHAQTQSGIWWSKTVANPDSSFFAEMSYQSAEVHNGQERNNAGFSVRCILNCSSPDVNLGPDMEICEDVTEIAPEADASNYSSLQWSTNGDGIFSFPNELYTSYSFGTNDYNAGFITLILTAQPINSCGLEISDTIHITLTPQPEVSAAFGQHYCPGDTVDLNATASNYNEVEWISVNGFGTIADDSDLNTVYYPAELDWLRGHTDFIIKVTAIAPCTDIVEDYVRIYFHELPEVDGGGDQLDVPGNSTKLWATEPPNFHTGVWTMVGTGGSFTDPTDPETMFSALVGVPYTLIWKITDTITGCKNTDTIIVEFKAPVPEANVPCPGIPTVTDGDGNLYNTVKIGSQCWMKENLRKTTGLTHYTEADQYLWAGQYNTSPWLAPPAYCWPQDDPVYYSPCGCLYNWNAMKNGNLCPSGWKVPSIDDYINLKNFLNFYQTPSSFEGRKMKDTSSTFWNQVNPGTNISGFTSLGCGERSSSTSGSVYQNQKIYNMLWASDIVISNEYVGRFVLVADNNEYFLPGYSQTGHKLRGLSVRCIKEGGYALEVLEVVTGEVSQIKPNSAKCGGVVTNMGGGNSIYKSGLVWDRQPNPTLLNNDGSSWNQSAMGSFSHTILNLDADTVYYVRAYVVNNVQDTAYGVIKEFNTKVPTVYYHSVGSITSTTAISGGTVVNNGGAEATVRGLIWSNNSNLTINSYLGIEVEGAGYGTYQITMKNLTPNTTYYVRAFARNGTGVGYGNIMIFQTLPPGIGDACPGINSLIDPRDGNVYEVVHMGNKCWMAENLKYLPEVHPISDNTDSGFRYYLSSYYGTDTTYAKALPYYQNYGVLYNYLAAMNACPPGWSLPSKADWIGMVSSIVSTTGFGMTVGVELKSCRSENTHLPPPCQTNIHPRWNWTHDPELYHGSDDYGFGILPGGYLLGQQGNGVIMIRPGGNAKFWTSTANGIYAHTIELGLLQFGYSSFQNLQWNGLNVRCVKN